MPKIQAITTSRQDASLFKRPEDRQRRTSTSNIHAGRGSKVSRVDERLARADNVPTSLITFAKAGAPQQVGCSSPATLQPDIVQWSMHAKRVPHELRSDHGACISHMRSVMYPIAMTGSEYWYKSLGNHALCVLDSTGQIICRISPAEDSAGLIMKESDAVIKPMRVGPKSYRTLLSLTLPSRSKADSFRSKAVRAHLQSKPQEKWSSQNHNASMITIEEKLNASMKKWADNHGGELENYALQMMGLEPGGVKRQPL